MYYLSVDIAPRSNNRVIAMKKVSKKSGDHLIEKTINLKWVNVAIMNLKRC